MTRTPTLAEVIRSALDARLLDVHTTLPAKVVRYDASRCVVDAAPLVKAPQTDESGVTTYTALPVVTNVPVEFPQGGGFRITFPIAIGDTVRLSFHEASLDRWMNFGGEVDPQDPRRFTLSDASAFPGIRALAGSDAVVAASEDGCVLEKVGGSGVRIKASNAIELGTSGAEALALASKVATELGLLKGLINTAAVSSADPGLAALYLLLSAWPASVASARVGTDS